MKSLQYRQKLIDLTQTRYLTRPRTFIWDRGWRWLNWFYLVKVATAIYFGWERPVEEDWHKGLAYFKPETSDKEWYLQVYWQQICTPKNFLDWSYGICKAEQQV